MSAINLIIARGFGPEVKELGTVMGDEKNRQRNANEVSQSNQVNTRNAQQDQQFQVEDRALDAQARQAQAGQQQELQALLAAIPEVDAILQKDPNNPEARAAAVEISTRLAAIAPKAAPTVSGILGMGGKGAASPAKPVIVMGPNGPVYADPQSAVGQAPYIRPQAPSGPPASEPLVAVQGPQGPVYAPRSQAAGMPPAQKPEAPAPTISPKDMAVAKNKRTQIAAARQQLQVVQDKFNAIKGGATAGPGQGLLPTPKGRAFDAAVNQLRNLQTSVTRVPGVGAMSDFENRLANAALPTRNEYEEVTQQQIDGLRDLLDVLDGGYVELLGGSGQTQGQSQGAPQAGGEYDYVPGKGLVKK